MRYIILLLLLSLTVSAWGPNTHQYFCNHAVEDVWGENSLIKCIREKDTDFLRNICKQAGNHIPEYKELCEQRILSNRGIHPSNVPPIIFLDEQEHKNYYKCPIKDKSKTMWFCGEKEEGKALEHANFWFNQMKNATNECERIYQFCIASHYFTDAQSQLHQVRYIDEDCFDIIESKVDEQITRGPSSVQASKSCEFERGSGSTKKKHEQRFGVRKTTLDTVLNDLKAEVKGINAYPYIKKSEVIILANSIDHDLAVEFYRYLRFNQIDVEYVKANQFETKKYAKNVIILGGHAAPEGVGEIVSDLYSNQDKQDLEKPYHKIMKVKRNEWTLNQKIFMIAGWSKEDTQLSLTENQREIVSALYSDTSLD